MMAARHAVQTRLCAALEGMADHLPARPRGPNALALAAALKDYRLDVRIGLGDLRASIADIGSGPLADMLTKLVAHVAARRIATIATAEDLIVAIEAPPGTPPGLCAEALGYMLRSFFDSCRDALMMEQLAVPLIASVRRPGLG